MKDPSSAYMYSTTVLEKLTVENMEKRIIEISKKFFEEQNKKKEQSKHTSVGRKQLYDYEYVIRYFDDRIGKILETMIPEVNKINKIFDTKFRLRERNLIF